MGFKEVFAALQEIFPQVRQGFPVSLRSLALCDVHVLLSYLDRLYFS